MKVTKTSRPAYEAPDTLVVKIKVEQNYVATTGGSTLNDMDYNEILEEGF